MSEKTFIKNFLGTKRAAASISKRAQRSIPAYQHFLKQHGLKPGVLFEQLPLTDKESYGLVYPFAELVGGNADKIFAIARSSGSSGNAFYWPILKADIRFITLKSRLFLEYTFAIHQKKTLAIVGLSLGSWLGGDSYSWALKNVAASSSYPFWVFSPGNHLDEIIEMIGRMHHSVEQIIVFLVPSAIAHLHLRAKELKQSLPLEKLRYVVLGEPFPESIRTSLQQQAGIAENIPFMFSFYGSADTGGLGVESLASIALRKLLDRNPQLAASLGIEFPIPHFFHFIGNQTFLETVNGKFCVTRWQGIPLVRYILYDQVVLYDWKKLKKAVLSSNQLDSQETALVKIIAKSNPLLPNLIAVTGRSDRCLILNGTNITESMLDAVVKSEDLHCLLTGLYRAQITYQEERQYLELSLEIQPSISSSEATKTHLYHLLVQKLGKVQPEFLDDWQNVYKNWDNDPTKRILQLNLLPWPNLSQATEKMIKQRGII